MFQKVIEFNRVRTPGQIYLDAKGFDQTLDAVNAIRLTPFNEHDTAGRPVHRQELLTQSAAVTFRPGLYVDRQPGLLHFEVERFDYLLAPGMPRRYLGNVTVVWDSEV